MIAKIEKFFKALGDKSRLRIITILGEKSVCVYTYKQGVICKK